MDIEIDPSALILVAILKYPRDLEIARLLGWYRIPLRSAPKVIAVDYLAFYQGGSFLDDKWRIHYLAEVHGIELTTREELFHDEIDHPHAKHEYYKIQLGKFIELPTSILAKKWKRVTFFYTTGEYLHHARELSDLVVHQDERRYLWKSLRERASKESEYSIKDLPSLDIDEEILAQVLGFYH
jgi:hypothetical protein